MPFTEEGDSNLAWKKPDWATGTKLRSTGKSASGDLAKPITNLPHIKDHGPGFSKPEWTDEIDGKNYSIGDKSLAKPITGLPHGEGQKDNLEFEKPDWTKTKVLKDTGKGEHLKQGGEIARPIGGIRAVADDM